jgi:hypothetical protein
MVVGIMFARRWELVSLVFLAAASLLIAMANYAPWFNVRRC